MGVYKKFAEELGPDFEYPIELTEPPLKSALSSQHSSRVDEGSNRLKSEDSASKNIGEKKDV